MSVIYLCLRLFFFYSKWFVKYAVCTWIETIQNRVLINPFLVIWLPFLLWLFMFFAWIANKSDAKSTTSTNCCYIYLYGITSVEIVVHYMLDDIVNCSDFFLFCTIFCSKTLFDFSPNKILHWIAMLVDHNYSIRTK